MIIRLVNTVVRVFINLAVQVTGAVAATYTSYIVHGAASLVFAVIGITMGVVAVFPPLYPMLYPGSTPSVFWDRAPRVNVYVSMIMITVGSTCYFFHEITQAPIVNLEAAAGIGVLLSVALAIKTAFALQSFDLHRARR